MLAGKPRDRLDEATLTLDTYGVPDVIEPAKSGRANCRGCGRAIVRGELRFGESLSNPYADGESVYWFHLVCAACMRPDKLGPLLDNCNQPVADPQWLRQSVSAGLRHGRLPRLLRAERAPSGAARCRHCRERVGKGSWRLALQMFEEGRMQSIGTIHLECAHAYFGTVDIIDRIERLTVNLNSSDLEEIAQRLQESPMSRQPEAGP